MVDDSASGYSKTASVAMGVPSTPYMKDKIVDSIRFVLVFNAEMRLSDTLIHEYTEPIAKQVTCLSGPKSTLRNSSA